MRKKGTEEFVDKFPIQLQASFYADMSRLEIVESQFEIIRDVFVANKLQGIPVDEDGYLFCCLIPILKIGVFYTFPKNFKGIIFLGIREMDPKGRINHIFDEESFDEFLDAARDLGFASSTSNLFNRLRSMLAD
ncbi:MAG: hypothetical protein ACKVQK_14610 [Burkholderiales bacterium]